MSTLTQHIDQAVAKRFYEQDGDLCQAWTNLLAEQCSVKDVAVWFDTTQPAATTRDIQGHFSAEFAEGLEEAWFNKQSIVYETSKQSFALFYPVSWYGEVVAVVFVHAENRKAQQLPSLMQTIQWSSGWLVTQYLHQFSDTTQQRAQQNHDLVTLFGELFAEQDGHLAINACLAKIARMVNVDRIYMGHVIKDRFEVKHVSGMDLPKNKTEWLRQIEDVMLEAYDQDNILVVPSESIFVTRAHYQLLQDKSLVCCATALVRQHDSQAVAAITVEKDSGEPLQAVEVELLEAFGVVLGPAIALQQQNMLPVRKIIQQRTQKKTGSLLKSRRVQAWSASIVFLLVALNIIHIPYRLTGDAVVEAAQIQTMSAPFDGFIAKLNVKPGDTISDGQVLVELDERELRLEQIRWQSEIQKLQAIYQEAIGNFDRTKQTETEAELGVAQTELAIIKQKLDKAKIRSPFAALIVEGDLRQRIGDVVAQGEGLISVAPANRYKIKIEIPEHKISDIALGSSGTLYLNAIPNNDWQISINSIIPNSQFNEGKAFFLIEGEISSDTELLRPGLRGIVKVDVEERSIMTILTQDLIAWLQRKAWALWG